MEENNYLNTNTVLMNLFVLHGQCDKIISRTCRRFNEMYPNLPSMDNKKFRRIVNNFKNFGSSLKVPRNLPRPVTSNEENEINVLAYFHAFPGSSIRSAKEDLGLTYYCVQSILDKHNMHDYKYTKVQCLKSEDYPQRENF